MERQDSVQRFLELIRRSHRGKFKVYIGMSAGVGKTCRMLQEARQLLDAGDDVLIGYIETHGRAGTEALVEGLPLVPRRRLFYKGKELEEMDTQAIVNLRPEIVVVDELAHTNIEGSENPKRWQDVMQILDAGISVISAVNIQHIEGLNEVVEEITGIEIRERVPDSVLAMADEVVNIDLTAEDLIDRLKAGKIYKPEKIQTALNNFFRQEHILQLRELALKEVALRVEKKVENEITVNDHDLGMQVDDALRIHLLELLAFVKELAARNERKPCDEGFRFRTTVRFNVSDTHIDTCIEQLVCLLQHPVGFAHTGAHADIDLKLAAMRLLDQIETVLGTSPGVMCIHGIYILNENQPTKLTSSSAGFQIRLVKSPIIIPPAP